MKKHIIVLAALLLAIVGNTFAADRLYTENFELLPGETKTVDILLDNPDAEYRDMQFDLYLPDGISVVKNGSGKYMVTKGSRCTEEHAVGLSFIDGHYVCTLYSVAKPPLAGNSGKVLSITLKAADDATIGQKSAYFRNVCLSKANATGPTYSEFSFGITVKNPEQPVTVTANNQTMVYGDEVPSLTYKKEGAELNGTPQLNTTATKTSAVGTYPITVTKGTVTNTLATYVNGTLTITKAPLTVTAKSYTIKQGDALPNFDVNYAGFKNNETAAVLTKKATATCAATSWSDVGNYEITVSGAKADNYDFSYVKGTLTITEADPFNLTYMVDGNVYKTYQVKYGAAITPEANPTKEGYTFSGWSEIPATMPAKDVTVTGSFTINNYKLTYKVDGETYKTTTVGYGITIIPEEAPTKEGYMFSGWSEIPSTMPAKDVTITGTFTKGQYKLIYMVDAQTYKTINFDYGVSITPEKAPEREGYTFSGWSEIPATMPAKDVTVTGSFTINKYKLTYKVDGETYKTYAIVYGADITPEAEPEKEGYSFSGWSEIPTKMPAKDVTVTGSFSINKYTLTYKVDGQTYKTTNVGYGTTIIPEGAPTKEGYTFSGWSEIPATMPAKEVTVTGTFTINKYKLTYKVDGETYKTYAIVYGADITLEAEPEKEGYSFSGWSEIPSTMPAKDVTITGTFTKGQYKLVYMVDGQTYKTTSIDFGVAISPEKAPEREGYTFSGWSEIPATMPAKDVTITGSFTINKYKLTYIVDGKTHKTIEVEYGTSITAEAEPVKEGYTFSGWSEIPAKMPAKDVTVTGSFSINKYTLAYKVDGQIYKTTTVGYGTTIIPEGTPTKEGYTFSGWSEIPATMPAKEVIVTGSFTINKYKLTYKVDGETYKTYAIVYGANITPEAEPEKEGYSFSGWSEIPSTMPAKDVTITGTFTKGQYTLVYMVDGQTYKTISINYGAAIIPEKAPEREGYTFSGWSEIPATMPAKELTITGGFTINKYTLTYQVDSKTYKTIKVEYGTSITAEAEPVKEGYTFSGWSEIPATMPAKDVTVTGDFTINKYTLTYKVDGETYKTTSVGYGTVILPEGAPAKDGYTFSGWSEIPNTMPAKDVIITGSFTKGQYKLVYMVDGQTYKTISIDYDVSVTPEEAPEREGYTFSGWSEIPAKMPAKDLTITGTFTINKYKLIYMVDGETYITSEIEYGKNIAAEAEPTKEGYSFSGWSEIPSTMPAKDVTITGSFTKGQYKLVYMVDGQTYKTISFDYGVAITPEQDPEREGYTFSGWSEIPATMPAKDLTITGSFTINKYTLTYQVDGQIYKTISMDYGNAITSEKAPEKEGYTFSGWSTIPTTMPAKDVTITGTFAINSYKLIYMVDGDTYKAYDLEYGSNITPEADPSREGKTFSGWSEIPAKMPAKDVTVNGSFATNNYKLIYIVDGETYKTVEVAYGTAIMTEVAPTKEGYTFSGWSWIPTKMPAEDVTVKGSFTINKYTLTYKVDDDTYKTISVDYGTAIMPEGMPTKEGYTFSGWSEIPTSMPAKDVTVSGKFAINKYRLIYMIDGETYETYEIAYGTNVAPEAEPTKEGYSFSGWSLIPTTMPANDVTITGSFTKGQYKLIYMVDGQTYKTIGIDYGVAIILEDVPEREGYTFSGWSSIPATMPAKDVTVTGSFTINKYTLSYTVNGETYKTYEVSYGNSITAEAEPTKEGYTFSGWSEIPATMPAHDVTITGSFTRIPPVASYKRNLSSQTTGMSSMIVGSYVRKSVGFNLVNKGSESIYVKEVVVKNASNYAVVSRSTDTSLLGNLEGGNSIELSVNLTSDITTCYEWHYTYKGKDFVFCSDVSDPAMKHDVTFYVDDNVLVTYEYDTDDEISPEEEPTKEGYTFSGWSEIPATMPNKDVTVKGTFTANIYTLTYEVDGEAVKTSNVEYETAIKEDMKPQKEGYTFVAEDEVPSTMPANDVTIKGAFTVNKYTLIYVVDEETIKTYEVEYGTAITAEAEPTKEGYTFSGWSAIPATMPAHDVTVTGDFTFIDAIEDVIADDDEYQIFTLDGKNVESLQKGVNIIRYSNGTTKSVYVK